MFDFAKKAIEIAEKHKADFGDIRVIETRDQDLSVKNGEIGSLNDSLTLGFGVRILFDGAWGFAASHITTPAEIDRGAPRDQFYRVPQTTADVVAARPVDLAVIDGIDTIRTRSLRWTPICCDGF